MTESSSAAPSDARRQQAIANAQAVVVKVGTRVLTRPDGLLDLRRVALLSEQLCRVADTGVQVVLVSSGAVGAGMGKLGITSRPTGLAKLQAIAAIGQTELIHAYESAMSERGRHAGQVLLTAADLRRRIGYLNVRNAMSAIYDLGAIAIVNENDSVAVGELMTTFGDNDRLAAAVASLFSDAILVILSDVNGLYDGPPELPESRLVPTVEKLDESVMGLASDRAGGVSKGGMASKLQAARTATSHGHHAVIAPGHSDDVLDRIFAAQMVGTWFFPSADPMKGVRRWIDSAAAIAGRIIIDAGAVQAITRRKASLLSIGITRCEGDFRRGDVVAICAADGQEIAHGLSNYRATEVRKIAGVLNDRVAEVLTHRGYDVVVHCDNMVVEGRHAEPLPQPPKNVLEPEKLPPPTTS